MTAPLSSIPDDLYEASALEGATAVQQFRHITFPLLKPFVNITIVLNTIYVFNSFPIIWVMTQGGPAQSTQMLAMWAYGQAMQLGDFGKGAAISVILLAITLAIVIPYLRWMLKPEAAR